MRRPRLPRIAIAVLSLFLGFTPLALAFLWNGDSLPGVVQKVLVGFGLLVTAVLFSLAERFSLVRPSSDLVQLFSPPEPEPERFSVVGAAEALHEGASVVLPASIGAAAADLAGGQAQDIVVGTIKDTIL